MAEPNTTLDDPPLALPAATLELDLFQVKVVRRALKRLRYEAERDARRNIASGWQPQPGKHDHNLHTVQAINALLGRLPLPENPL